MIEADRLRFARLMHHLYVAFPSRGASAERHAVYFRALGKFRIETLEVAAVRWTEHGTKFPTAGDLAAGARHLKSVPEGRPVPQLMEPPANPEHARECVALCVRFLSKKTPLAEQVVAFQAMDAKWPGKGWDETAKQTEAEIVKRAADALRRAVVRGEDSR